VFPALRSGSWKDGKIGKMPAKLVASCLLLVAAAAAQNPPAKKRASLDAEITALSPFIPANP
jgi:hypothetical protein